MGTQDGNKINKRTSVRFFFNRGPLLQLLRVVALSLMLLVVKGCLDNGGD